MEMSYLGGIPAFICLFGWFADRRLTSNDDEDDGNASRFNGN